jgi:Cdc6-like AAA superfamily ATPase
MSRFKYELANDFDRAWLNFELDLPLLPERDGTPNPFYLLRPENTLRRLIDELISPFYMPPKIFISGHRGTGKSTELKHLLANQNIQQKFWATNFSIREEADIIDLDLQDILFAMGSRLYRDYKKAGGVLPAQLLKELETWRGDVEVEIKKASGKIVESEISAGIDAFFLSTGVKLKLEPDSRKTIRQVLKPRTQELIMVINKIAQGIYAQERRIPMIIIDDLDKIDLQVSRKIFGEYIDILLSPRCAIIYVTTMASFYSNEFDNFRDRAYFLPAVKLHEREDKEKVYLPGYQMLKSIIETRMSLDLITKEALDAAIKYSGGIVREEIRLMRSAIGKARREKHNQVLISDVMWAVLEIKNEYERILDNEDLDTIKGVVSGTKHMTDRVRPLMQLLAILEYLDNDGNRWFETHPVLEETVKEFK